MASTTAVPVNTYIHTGLNIKVTDSYYVGDGKHFDKQFFIVTVLAESLRFSCDRSYVDFVEFDRQLRKKFPETKIRKLPLDDADLVKRILVKEASTLSDRRKSSLGAGMLTSTRNSLQLTRESIIGGGEMASALGNNGDGMPQLFRIPDTSIEHFVSKQDKLSDYLSELLLKHEIVASEELLRFLDEETRNMTGASDEPEDPLNAHDLLLINNPVNKCIVGRTEEYQFHLPARHLIVYRFSTLNYDIGFSVEMNGTVKVPYTRSSSHKAPICGTLEALEPSTCVLKWDNSYAKLRTKQLMWSARVASAEEYLEAKAQALEVQRERKRFEQQRFAVQRCALRFAAELSGVAIHESSVLPDHAHEERQRVASLETEVLQLRGEVEALLADLGKAEGCVEQLQGKLQAADAAKQVISDSWHFSASQLESAEQELDNCHQIIEDLHIEIENKDNELDELEEALSTNEMETQRGDLMLLKTHREQLGHVTRELRKAEQEQVHYQRKMLERQGELSAILSSESEVASAPYASISAGAVVEETNQLDIDSSSSSRRSMNNPHQRQVAKLVSLVENLMSDVENSREDIHRKNALLKQTADVFQSTISPRQSNLNNIPPPHS